MKWSALWQWMTRSRSAENPSIPLTDPVALRELFGTSESDSGELITVERCLQFSPLWQGITMIGGDISIIPTFVYRRLATGGKERDTRHPAYYLLRRKANRYMTANVWKQLTITQALLYGNAYSRILRDNAGRPRELIPLDPETTRLEETNQGLRYHTRINQTDRRFMPDNVLHIRGLSLDGLNGLSLIEFGRNSVGRGLASERYSNKFFANSAMPRGLLTHPHKLNDEAFRNLRESWNKIYGTTQNAHRVAILEEGMTWTTIGVKPEDAQMIASMQFSVKDASRLLNIPPHRLGDDSRTAYNTLEQENLSYQQSTLGPWFCKLREEQYDKLLTEEEKRSDSHIIEEQRNAILAADAKTRNEVYTQGILNGYLSRDEVREFENLNPIPDGEGKTFFVPLNVKTTGEDEETEEVDDAEGTTIPDVDGGDQDGGGNVNGNGVNRIRGSLL